LIQSKHLIQNGGAKFAMFGPRTYELLVIASIILFMVTVPISVIGLLVMILNRQNRPHD